jgi:hypothetical protein
MGNAGRGAPDPRPTGRQPATRSGIGVSLLCLALALTAISCSSHSPKGGIQTMGTPGTFFLRAAPQSSNGKTIVVDQASFHGVDGYVAIHANGGGAPGPTIGVSQLLKAGVTTHITIALTKPLANSGTVFAILHIEDNHNTTFDYPRADQAATIDGRVVVIPVPVTVHK